MGFKASTGQATWMSLSNGKFVIKDGNGTKQSYPAFEGLLVAIEFRDTEFEGKKKREVLSTFRDNGLLYRLGMDMSGGYGRQYLAKVVVANLARPMELVPTFSEDGGKKQSGMFVNQDGLSLRQKWTRDNPGDLPEPESIEFGGKKHLSFKVQQAYLEQYIMEHVAPVVALNISRSNAAPSTQEAPGENVGYEGGDEANDPF